ncbi:Phenylacetic acid catabolic protein, partial [Cupriavidus pinatubonensis]
EQLAAAQGVAVPTTDLRDAWEATVDETLAEATLEKPVPNAFVSTGKHGLHSEHMSYLLAEMQSLARAHPGAQW